MKNNLCFVLFSLFMSSHLYAQNEPLVTNNHAAPLNNPITASDDLAQGFSELALACIDKEYPNIIKHMMTGPSDVKTPKQLYPAFYGCFDWHSSVHGHWLLVRLLHKSSLLNDANMSTSSMPNRQAIIDKLSKSFTDKNIAGELAYFNRPNTGSSFERPYGLAWFLQLTAELRQWQDPLAEKWLTTLLPLEKR